jgi:hypothetical protein
VFSSRVQEKADACKKWHHQSRPINMFFVMNNNKEQSSKRLFLLTSHHRLLPYKQEFCAEPFLPFLQITLSEDEKTGRRMTSKKRKM